MIYTWRFVTASLLLISMPILLIAMVVSSVMAQGTPSRTLTPTETQFLRLENAQLRARLAVADVKAAQQRYQEAMLALSELGNATIKDNKWPEGTQFDIDKLTFSSPLRPKSNVPYCPDSGCPPEPAVKK